MDFLSRLDIFINYFQSLCISVSTQPGPKGLPASEEGEYKQKVYEVCDLLHAALGDKDPYPERIINVYNNVRGDWNAVSLSNIRQILGFVKAAHTKLQLVQAAPCQEKTTQTRPYIEPDRINQLRKIKNPRFDLSRLIRMCEELEISHQNGCTISIAMLMRGIIDHIPPIFAVKSFRELANNSADGKSFRKAMLYLEDYSRNVADSYLHIQIRKHESVPNATQVNFSAQLDMLLAEVIRLLGGDN